MIYLLVIIAAVLEVIGQLAIKHYTLFNKNEYLALGMLLYAIICIALSKLYRYKSIGIVQALWSGFSILASVCSGYVMYNDKISNIECIGIIFIIIGVILLYEHS